MEFFDLMAAMKARAPVMTKLIHPSYTTLVVGTVAGISYRLDADGEVRAQAEILERGTNSVTVVSAGAVEKVWEHCNERVK